MVDDEVLLPDRGEAVAGMFADALGKTGIVGHEFEIGTVDRGELRHLREREHAVDHEHLVLGHRRAPAARSGADPSRHRRVELEPDDRAAPAALEHGLERAHQVFGFFLDFQVGIPDHAEGALPLDRIARKQLGDEQRGDLLQRDQARGAVRRRGQADEAVDLLRKADQRVHRFPVAGAHEMERQGEAEIGNEREGMGGVDRERRQNREDVAQEMVGEPRPVGLLERIRIDEHDAVAGELGAKLAPARLLVAGKPGHRVVDADELLGRSHPVRAAGEDAGAHLPLEAGDPHHEELVEIVRGDRKEADPLEKRMLGIVSLLEDSPVEVEPRQLAIDVKIRSAGGKRGGRIDADRLRRAGRFNRENVCLGRGLSCNQDLLCPLCNFTLLSCSPAPKSINPRRVVTRCTEWLRQRSTIKRASRARVPARKRTCPQAYLPASAPARLAFNCGILQCRQGRLVGLFKQLCGQT